MNELGKSKVALKRKALIKETIGKIKFVNSEEIDSMIFINQ